MDNEAERRIQAAIEKMMTGVLEGAMELTERGFQFPFHIVFLGINGSVTAFRSCFSRSMSARISSLVVPAVDMSVLQ